jgi:integrase
MGKKSDVADRDRHLTSRNGIYSYKRRVPAKVAERDTRAPFVRISLGTRDLAQARALRDGYEKADDELWAAMIVGSDRSAAEGQYKAAVARATALGFTYRHSSMILTPPVWEPGDVVTRRFEALMEKAKPGSAESAAIIGMISSPTVKVTEAFDIYCDEIVAAELIGKSEKQKKDWKKVKQRAVTNFTEVVEDKAIAEISRDDARKFFRFWGDRVAPKEGKPTHSASSGNRDVGNMRVLYEDYFKHLGVEEIKNPFDGLVFAEKIKRKRPPFPTEWIANKILEDGVLDGMNVEGRGVVLALIETGCRPSEICNLISEHIKIDAPIPHIMIEPRTDPDDPREIKTVSSIRAIPLVGVALEVFKQFPKGFPRYKEKETSMSNALNKFFRQNLLFPTPKHKIYSFRHSFEDRMKVAGLDTELRKMLMGHTIDRPDYGEGGSLEWKRNELKKIALPFEPSIVSRAQVRNKQLPGSDGEARARVRGIQTR